MKPEVAINSSFVAPFKIKNQMEIEMGLGLFVFFFQIYEYKARPVICILKKN
jgi:hypothetical protein